MTEPLAPSASGIDSLLRALGETARPVLVQTHDYPDIDAVASAWALAGLLRTLGRETVCAYCGEIRSRSLRRLLAEIGEGLLSQPPSAQDAAIIVVDGSPANGNVTLFPGTLTAVIDHHRAVANPDAPFVDIRPELASCSAMVLGYWQESGALPPPPLATALLAGIQSDTDFLSRRATASDFAACSALYGIGDWAQASRIVRTVLDLRELEMVMAAMRGAEIREGVFFADLVGPCGQEVLSVLADFALRAEELRMAVVAESDDNGIHVSVRSKLSGLSAFEVVREALSGIGSGGGHSHAAGGIVPIGSIAGAPELRERFFVAARKLRSS